ncbi:FGGY-family carbohydrate kinase [Jeotgalibacillus malaysiensis]|uniref:FGGY-family carbohydrate kinase n=1 Tax=Jeotgalibacillus malaysiensis TaxID=1508404 RepID=UPI003850DE6C
MNNHALFIGVDIGTQGIRCVAVDETGNVIAVEKHAFTLDLDEGPKKEQHPDLWILNTFSLLKRLTDELKFKGKLNNLVALSVSSTSGTVIPLDGSGIPLHPAIMYHDRRAESAAVMCNEASKRSGHSTKFNASYGLPKIKWFHDQFPDKAGRIKYWAHAADYVIGCLTGRWGVTDYTNALKTGYDLESVQWPVYISELDIDFSLLPDVTFPGDIIGRVSRSVAEKTGLPEQLKVTAGLTDGCASQFAAGAISPGMWNTTIGTTMVIKGVTNKPPADPEGRVYSHKHPDGFWMPGGASNTGAIWIRQYIEDMNDLNQSAEALFPTGTYSYPLNGKGERFPFQHAEATGFDHPDLSREALYTSRLEGVGYLERMSFELIADLSGEQINEVYTAGGGSNSFAWLKIRSNILNKPVIKMKYTDGAVGVAIIAASRTRFNSLQEAGKYMLLKETIIEPDIATGRKFEEYYQNFVEIMGERGYKL